jgi:transposase, IS5 family
VVVRLLVLKHARNWSNAVLEREVRANLIYRNFTGIGFGKMADAKTMGKWGLAIGPEVIKQVHDRIMGIAQEKGLAQGAKMSVDTTVVETNIHYPTDSSLLGDGVRVLTRVMKKVTKIAGEVGYKMRDRTRSVKHRVMEIGRAARAKSAQSKGKLQKAYANLLNSRSRVVGQAKRFAEEILDGTTSNRGQAALECCKGELEQMIPRVRQVIAQTRARIFRGEARTEGKIFSLFEPSTEIIRR